MSNLIDEILTFQKIDQENIEFKEISINNLLDEIQDNYKIQIANNKLKFTTDKIPNVNGNYTFLKILFNNLVSNSIKYQTKIPNHIPEIRVEGKRENKSINIYFSDNGIGIESTYLNQLFEPFIRFHSSSEYKGTGLGMSICKKIMCKHNGEISLEKTSTKGTTFKLRFKENPTANRVGGLAPN